VLSTGHPCSKTHLARGSAAAKLPEPDHPVLAAMRTIQKLASRRLRGLLQRE